MCRLVPRLRGRRGFTLIETLIALGILGFTGVAFMAALSGAFQAQGIGREQLRAENLARAALEDIRNQDYSEGGLAPGCYPDCYTLSFTPPAGYSVSVETEGFCNPQPCTPPDDKVQKNTVRVSRGGRGVVTVEDLRSAR